MRTAAVASAMFRESNGGRESSHKSSVSQMRPIKIKDRNHVIAKAIRCLEWAHDPARPVVPGAENMTKDQVRVRFRVRFRVVLLCWVWVTTDDQVGDDLSRDWVCLGTPQNLMLICLSLKMMDIH